MPIQTNPEMFSPRFPVYTVSSIDKASNDVTLRSSAGAIEHVPLSAWGPFEDAWPLVGSQVQLLPD